MKTWVLAADSSNARIFATDSRVGTLAEVLSLSHPQSRQHEQTLTSDLPGRSFDRAGQGRHVMGASVSPKEHEVLAFAEEIVEALEKARNDGKFNQLIVVAAPAFLGELRKRFPTALSRLVVLELDKNLNKEQFTAEEIRGQLPERLPVL